jgi:hypothetical protein
VWRCNVPRPDPTRGYTLIFDLAQRTGFSPKAEIQEFIYAFPGWTQGEAVSHAVGAGLVGSAPENFCP